jgi:hypothetical protein
MRRPLAYVLLLSILASIACDEGTPDTSMGAADAGGIDVGDSSGPIDARPGNPDVAYDVAGPHAFTVTEHDVNGASVTLYMPDTPGLHPVVAHACGSSQSAAGYVPYAERLASYGIAMILVDDPGALTNTSDIVPNLVYAVDTWLPATFPDAIDVSKVGLSGHSRGGAVSLLAAEHALAGKVVAWFGIDPVDNQFLIAPGEYARTDLASIGIPTVFLGAEVTSNCAPAADSYPTLSPLAPDPSVLIVGLGAGHTQFQVASACNLCSVCSPDGTADANVVLAYSVRYFTAFFARELLGDASVGARFEGAGAPADIAAGWVTVM